MKYNCNSQRGVMDKSFVSVKGSFHKSMSHSEVLSKCTEITCSSVRHRSIFLVMHLVQRLEMKSLCFRGPMDSGVLHEIV